MKNKKGYSSRVERNSTKNRLKRRIKKNTKRLPKVIVKNLVYLIVGILYTIYLIIRGFDTLVAKLFMNTLYEASIIVRNESETVDKSSLAVFNSNAAIAS